MSTCSPLIVDEALFVCTSNGVNETHVQVPAPDAPSFLAMNRNTGEVLWSDNSPGSNILHGQWASPSYGVFDGQPQVLFPGGDGWLYSFDPSGDGQGNSRLLWKFDANPKTAEYNLRGRSGRNPLIGFAVIDDGLIYIAVGDDPEHGEGEGHLWCLAPGARADGSDVSSDLAVHRSGRILPPRRLQAVNVEVGEETIPNPNSAVVWHYTGGDVNGDGRLRFEEEMHRSIGSPVIKDDVLYIADFGGILHCLNAKTGVTHWTYDTVSQCWGTVLVADDTVYLGTEYGEMLLFQHSAERDVALPDGKPLAVIDMFNSILMTPVVANGVLFVASKNRLYAIAAESGNEPTTR
jgi:outer membrane protein assembly factor BamB